MSDKNIYTRRLFNAVALSGSDDTTSEAIDLNDYKPEGFFSIQITTVGASSVAKVEFLLSDDNTTYVTPSGASDIVTSHSPGTDIYDFGPEVAGSMKIKVSETSGNDITSLTVDICIQ